jgi:hypothetical protein
MTLSYFLSLAVARQQALALVTSTLNGYMLDEYKFDMIR